MAQFDNSADICQRLCGAAASTTTDPYYEGATNFFTSIYPADSQQPDNSTHFINEDNYWESPCSSNSPASSRRECSPTDGRQRTISPGPYHHYQHVFYAPQYEKLGPMYEEGYFNTTGDVITSTPFVRVIKRRNTANKKERRRTQSINSAFSYLRERIPNVPADTKLSKIKTLRLATSYISYLTRVLEGDQDPSSGFRAELVPSSRKINAERRANMKNEVQVMISTDSTTESKKTKGRTGWPQDVWNSVLKQEQQ